MQKTDKCISFYFQKSPIRGQFCRISKSITAALSNHAYPDSINKVLAEMTAISHCFTANVKSGCSAVMQLTGDSQIITALVDLHSEGFFRCCAAFTDDFRSKTVDPILVTVPELFGSNGRLLFTMDFDGQRYQTVIPLEHLSLQECFQHYFNQSEQIPSIILIASRLSENRIESASLILQKMPEFLENDAASMSWDEAKIFTQTIRTEELIDLNTDMEKFIHLVYNELSPIVSRETTIDFKCKCSEKKIKETVFQLGISEKLVDITCDYCNKKYNIDMESKNL